MANSIARYEFSERLADILGESRRDLRFRVTLMVSSGLVAAGPRGRGSPPATPEYAAQLLIGAMAAPQQAQTVEAISCYGALQPRAVAAGSDVPRVLFGPAPVAGEEAPHELTIRLDGLRFVDALAGVLELACAEETRAIVASEFFGVWVNRACPVAALQFSTFRQGRRAVISHTYGLAADAAPPAWLDPQRGGAVDPGLFHSVFLPVRKMLEIGLVTTLSDDNRSSSMIKKLGHKVAAIARMAELAAKTPHGKRWEKLLSALAAVQAWSDQVDAQEHRLCEVQDFGSNPGELRMLTYLPANLPKNAPLVVVLHGCTQSAASYNKGAGWSTLADRHGFALLFPQQQWNNNPLRCFNWFRPEDNERERGEPVSIRQMVDKLLGEQQLDRRRVYVTGTSSGGAMTAVLLATYPEVFAGGAILAGVPYRAANGLQEGLETIFVGRSRSPCEWGDLVRAASPHRGPWPKLSVWHGDADTAVKPVNAEEILKQWTDLHGLALSPTIETRVDGHARRVWLAADGDELIESYTIAGMAHGAAIDPGAAPHQCGTAAPFFNAVGISSTHRIAEFWGLCGERAGACQAPAGAFDGVATATADAAPANSGVTREGEHLARDDRPGAAGSASGAASAEPAGAADDPRSASRPFGLDVHGIIAASLQAAGLLKGDQRRSSGSAPLGIDVPAIVSTALEAAGVLKGIAARSAPANSEARLKAAGWQGSGWEMLHGDARAFRGGAMLYGCVASGEAGTVGARTSTIARRLTLGERPELSYVRRLDLSAAVNDYTSASFRVLVDGVVVDEVTAIGMLHQENEWLRRPGIDLARFAHRTVVLTLEVAAYANSYSPVQARAWVDDITIHSAVDVIRC